MSTASTPLLRIRAGRAQMSAIERRIADFILDNAHLLRDYSSQQLASALGISQSSVVKFSQKLGFKGYPDLKYGIGQDVARSDGQDQQAPGSGGHGGDYARIAHDLQQARGAAQAQTHALNIQADVEAIVARIDGAPKLFVYGLGDDGLYAREFAMRLSLLGMLVVHHADPILMQANLSAARSGDVMLVFSEFGQLPQLSVLARQFQDQHGTVVAITRNTANPLRALADAALVVSAEVQVPPLAQVLYRAALQSLLDFLFVLLCQANPDRNRQLGINLEGIERLLDL